MVLFWRFYNLQNKARNGPAYGWMPGNLWVGKGEMEKATELELPKEMTVGGVTYEVVSCLKEGEESVDGDVMMERAWEMKANLGQDDGEFILAHQDEIPVAFRDKIEFVFPNWRSRRFPSEIVICVEWEGDHWEENQGWLEDDWCDFVRLLRRK